MLIEESGVRFEIDDSDYESIRGKRVREWGEYIYIEVEGEYISIHRWLMNCPENMEVDHKDRNPRNNKRSNLRVCTKQENMRNRSGSAKSGYKCVYYCEESGLWLAQISIGDSKHQHIGRFTNKIAAANAYNFYAKMYFGEFALLNDVEFMSDWDKYRRKKNKTSKYIGVSFSNKEKKWISQIWDGRTKKNVILGTFYNEEDAAREYNKAAIQMRGLKAKLNNVV